MFVLALQLIILSVCLGQFGRVELGGSLVLYVQDVLVALTLGVWLFDFIAKRRRIVLSISLLFLLLFFLVACLSLVFNAQWLDSHQLLVSGFYLVRLVIYMSLLFVVVDVVQSYKEALARRKVVLKLVNTLVITAVLLAMFGFVQFALFPDFSVFVSHGWDPHYYRVLSTFFDPNFIGGYFVLGLILTLSLALLSKPLGLKLHWYLLAFATIAAALVLTFSRSSYLAAMLGLGFLTFWQSRKLFFLAILAAILIFAFVPRVQERVLGAVRVDATAQFRIEAWQRGWQIARDNPVLGVGYNAFRYAQMDYGFIVYDDTGGHSGAGTDSSLLLIFATTGLLGTFFFVAFYFFTGLETFLTLWRTKLGFRYLLALVVASSLIAVFAHSQFVNSLLYPWVIIWLAVIIGLYCGLYKKVMDDET